MAEKEAFCLLLWRSRGGRVDNRGKAIVSKHSPSGSCDEPTDCYKCPLLQQEVSMHPAGQTNWVCPACLPEICRTAKTQGRSIHLTGHYTEGRCQYVRCTRPPRSEFRDVGVEDVEARWKEGDIVELPSGYSRFLQLVIGDINT
jgi:hypothetical protein